MSKSLVRKGIHVTRGWGGAVHGRWLKIRRHAEAGMSTAEYAVGTLAACTFAAVLIAVVRSDAVRGALSKLITSALSIAS